ncbi:LbetaH domain-containing protein [Pedobacter metabolipauper]|uniref:Putative colanic acid biosynthesis acetyltransferase WcaF n=1 Tax=Pedobacter metabolipauper TaxID=425513 RepID=A0A4R6SX45_9SPHI|nr:putative colanic acid biosynthesis acetyltransferase [Pedobacter metabolipauper]TDQ09996.1 putative colanic acid biosynthesis acetyltransferase WcaF [Pedobacter metabolipauper]
MTDPELEVKNAYVQPVFTTGDKIKRLIWQITWLVLCRYTPAPLYFWRNFILRLFGARLGKKNHIYPSCKIWAPWLLETDDHAAIGPGAEVYNPGGVYLGKHAILSQDSYLCGATHDYDSANFTYIKREIRVEAYAWICAKAIVLPGIHCKTGSVLAAGAVLSKNMEEWTIYGGNPAVKLKIRVNFT